jgi:hypothetical protein
MATLDALSAGPEFRPKIIVCNESKDTFYDPRADWILNSRGPAARGDSRWLAAAMCPTEYVALVDDTLILPGSTLLARAVELLAAEDRDCVAGAEGFALPVPESIQPADVEPPPRGGAAVDIVTGKLFLCRTASLAGCQVLGVRHETWRAVCEQLANGRPHFHRVPELFRRLAA